MDNQKEKLIELIQASVGGWMYEDAAERIAEHLLKNGVRVPCKYEIAERWLNDE